MHKTVTWSPASVPVSPARGRHSLLYLLYSQKDIHHFKGPKYKCSRIVMRVETLRMDTIISFKPREASNINPMQDVKKVRGPFIICTSQTLNILKKTSPIRNFKRN